jgi:hypothetical protein
MTRRLWLSSCLSASALLAAAPNPREDLLGRAKAHISEMLARLPNYTCTEKIERAMHPAETCCFYVKDTVRLEVSFVGGMELFARPGAPKFEQESLSRMVRGKGAIATGGFASHARAIFSGDTTEFQYAGAGKQQGRSAHRFDFRVPLGKSELALTLGPQREIMAYRGSFWVDAENLDLLRLEIRVDGKGMQKMSVVEVTDTIEYARTRIGASEFVLPNRSIFQVSYSTGAATRNTTQFGACRQYAGQSVIKFDGPSSEPEPGKR